MKQLNIPTIENALFSTSITIRISDINYGNHLGHDALISLLHESRIQLLSSLEYGEKNEDGLGLIMKNILVDYTKESFYGDKLTFKLDIDNISKMSFEIIYNVENQHHKLIATALTTMISFDYNKSKVSKIPKLLIENVSNAKSLNTVQHSV